MKLNLLLPFLLASVVFGQPSSEVQFTGCTEYVGAGLIPAARAASFVPAGLTLANPAPGQALLVTRTSQCAAVRVDNTRPEPATLAQIGVSIIAPEADGDINNYTIQYVTNNRRLAQRLERAGLPVVVDEDLVYEVNGSNFFADVSPSEGSAFFFSGTVSEPNPAAAFPFTANWWFKSNRGLLKMNTVIPAIAFGSSNVTVFTRRNSPLGILVNGNSFSDFSVFNVRGAFSSARMFITLR